MSDILTDGMTGNVSTLNSIDGSVTTQDLSQDIEVTGDISPVEEIGGDITELYEIDGDVTPLQEIGGDITYGIGTGGGEGGSGTRDYNELYNKPQIESVTLRGDKTFEELGLSPMEGMEILAILI